MASEMNASDFQTLGLHVYNEFVHKRTHCGPLQLRTTAMFALSILSRRPGEDLPHASRVLVDELRVGGRLLRPGGVEGGRVLNKFVQKLVQSQQHLGRRLCHLVNQMCVFRP